MNSLLLDGPSQIDGLMKKTGPFGGKVDCFVAEKDKMVFEVPFDLLKWT